QLVRLVGADERGVRLAGYPPPGRGCPPSALTARTPATTSARRPPPVGKLRRLRRWTASARQAPWPRHGDHSVPMPVEGLDQLSLAQLGQCPAHRRAGNRVLSGELIIGWQGRAK